MRTMPRAHAGEPLEEIRVALRALEQLAHDEERPPLSDQAERVTDGAVLVVALHGERIIAHVLAPWKEELAKEKRLVLGCKLVTTKRERNRP